jgi:TetR/AcrR family transcriptional regulator, regulator of autoinduction and epiphytic fitness
MAEENRLRRSYHSTRRQETARLTRQAIAQAALTLFNQRGYRGASMDAIAKAAGVATETVYATFGSKRELLHYLLNVTVGGDEAPVRVIDRPEPQAVLQETDARRLISGFSSSICQILERAAPVFTILTEAAKTEPELEALQSRFRSERLENMGKVVRALSRLAPLRLSEVQAAETLWSLTSPELFSLLTGVRQWDREKYAAWLQDSLDRLLLG